MKNILLTFLLLCPLLSFGQVKSKQSYTINGGFKVEFWRFEPGVPVEGKKPVVIFYHGLGTGSIDAVLNTGLAGAINSGATKWPAVVLAPYSFSGWWEARLYSKPLVDWIRKQTDLDTNRVYICGLSSGGNGVYTALTDIDDRIAAYAPNSINSTGFVSLIKANKKRPVWHFHGGKDGNPNVVSTSEAFITKYNQIFPGMAKRTVFTNLGHNAWDAVYRGKLSEPHTGSPFNMLLIDWFLQYTLGPTTVPPVDPPVIPVDSVVKIWYKPTVDSIYFQTKSGKVLKR